MDLEGDALIEGNTFMNFVRDQYNKASGESNVLSAGAGKHYTMTHNIFLNSQHIVQVKDGSFLTFLNNTAVNISREAIYFDLHLPGRKPGRGAVVQNSIFWNTVEVFEGITEQIDLTVDHCLMPVPGSNLGVGNISADPLFARAGYWDPNGTPNNPKDDFWVEGDYHLKSKTGRWDPATAAVGHRQSHQSLHRRGQRQPRLEERMLAEWPTHRHGRLRRDGRSEPVLLQGRFTGGPRWRWARESPGLWRLHLGMAEHGGPVPGGSPPRRCRGFRRLRSLLLVVVMAGTPMRVLLTGPPGLRQNDGCGEDRRCALTRR